METFIFKRVKEKNRYCSINSILLQFTYAGSGYIMTKDKYFYRNKKVKNANMSTNSSYNILHRLIFKVNYF